MEPIRALLLEGLDYSKYAIHLKLLQENIDWRYARVIVGFSFDGGTQVFPLEADEILQA